MIKLRDYQDEAVVNVQKSFFNGFRRVCVVLPCGGGKSVIIADIARRTAANKRRVMFLVHRKELLTQVETAFRNQDVDFGFCDLVMMQTGTRHLDRYKEPSLIMVDEAHHILNRSYRRILDHFPNSRVVGFTATPQRMNEGGLGAVFEKLILTVSTDYLVKNHYLAPLKCFALPLIDAVALKALHTSRGDYVAEELEQIMNKPVIFGDAVENWKAKCQGKKTIVYCTSINTAIGTAAAYREAGIAAADIHSKTPQAERDALVAAFRNGEITVLCNVDLFGEGFDVPDCEVVQMLRPTRSLTVHIQQSTRAMRFDKNNPDKIAMLLDHVNNINNNVYPTLNFHWTLDPKTKQKKQTVTTYRQCPECFAWVKRIATMCPECGYIFRTGSKKPPEFIDGVMLEEIKPLYTKYDCENFSDILRYVHEREPKAHKWRVYNLARELNMEDQLPDTQDVRDWREWHAKRNRSYA